MANGKKIGSKWERDFCRYISRWIEPDSKEVFFWRSAGSGSVFTTSKGKIGDNFAGDIYAIDDKGEFICDCYTFELKAGYPDYSIDSHLKSNKSDDMKSFWEQCVGDAILSDKKPILIFKKKRVNPWICIGIDLYSKLKKKLKNLQMVHLIFSDIKIEDEKYKEMFVFDMDLFFKTITPKDFKKIKW